VGKLVQGVDDEETSSFLTLLLYFHLALSSSVSDIVGVDLPQHKTHDGGCDAHRATSLSGHIGMSSRCYPEQSMEVQRR